MSSNSLSPLSESTMAFRIDIILESMALANTPAIPELAAGVRRSSSGTSCRFLRRVLAWARSLAVKGRPPSSLDADWVLSGGAGGAFLVAGRVEGGAVGGGGGGTGGPMGGGGGGDGAPIPFMTGGGGGTPFETGSWGGGGAAAGTVASVFSFDFGGCLNGKSSYSTMCFLPFLVDAATGGLGVALLEGSWGFGGKCGSGLSVSWVGGSELSFIGRGGTFPLICLCGIGGNAFSGSLGGNEGMVLFFSGSLGGNDGMELFFSGSLGGSVGMELFFSGSLGGSVGMVLFFSGSLGGNDGMELF